jgi:hypothetical protein
LPLRFLPSAPGRQRANAVALDAARNVGARLAIRAGRCPAANAGTLQPVVRRGDWQRADGEARLFPARYGPRFRGKPEKSTTIQVR